MLCYAILKLDQKTYQNRRIQTTPAYIFEEVTPRIRLEHIFYTVRWKCYRKPTLGMTALNVNIRQRISKQKYGKCVL